VESDALEDVACVEPFLPVAALEALRGTFELCFWVFESTLLYVIGGTTHVHRFILLRHRLLGLNGRGPVRDRHRLVSLLGQWWLFERLTLGSTLGCLQLIRRLHRHCCLQWQILPLLLKRRGSLKTRGGRFNCLYFLSTPRAIFIVLIFRV
jgi:hypothetical protein